MDLQERLARLKRHIETIAGGIDGMRVDLAAVRNSLDRLRLKPGPPVDEEGHKRLTEISWALIARVGDLEKLATSLANAANDLQACLGDVERDGPDAPEDVPGDLVAVKLRLEALQSELDAFHTASDLREVGWEEKSVALHRRLERVESRLQQLAEGQEGLELQTALLSKEAEQDIGPAPRPSVTPMEADTAMAQSAEALQAMQRRLAMLIEQADRLASVGQPSQDQVEMAGQLSALQSARASDQRQVEQIRASTAALESRVQGLQAEGERLDRAVSRLSDEVLRPPDSGPVQGDLAAVLTDEVAAVKAAGGSLHDRLIKLEERRNALQETVEDLSLRQARQDNETRALQRRVRQRSILGMVGFLVAIAVLGLAWFRMPAPVDPEALTAQAEAAARRAVQPLIARQARDVARLQEEVSAIVARLDDADERWERTRTEIQAMRARLRQEVAKMAAEAERLAEASKRLSNRAFATTENSPVPSSAGVAAVAPSVPRRESPPPVTAPPAPPPKAASGPEAIWAQARAKGRYTLQLVGVSERRHMAWFLQEHRVAGDNAIHHSRRGGRQWLELFHGIYPTPGAALEAARKLPAGLAAQNPWVRRIPASGRLEPLR